jgi:hypothetical protein
VVKNSNATVDWLIDSDPALRWRVEKDLLGLDQEVWEKTRSLTGLEGFGARLLQLQDTDGTWAGGAYFPQRRDPRAIVHPDDESGQPYVATTWSLNQLREWGVDSRLLRDTAKKLEESCKWEYENLPYWAGEVDCCINAFTLANGAWLGQDVSHIADWFLDHQLEDGGWNCDWIEGAKKSSFHSTLNSLIGLLDYEVRVGRNESLYQARKRAEEYLLSRRLIFGLKSQDLVGPWVGHFKSPARWRYSALRALNYFRDANQFDNSSKDSRLGEAVDLVKSLETQNGRWLNFGPEKGSVWFETDVSAGQESKWVTFFATRVVTWWGDQ